MKVLVKNILPPDLCKLLNYMIHSPFSSATASAKCLCLCVCVCVSFVRE